MGEAAQLWASISNYSRIFARLILTFVESHNHTPQYDADTAKAYHKEMLHRHIAWVNIVRLQLREQSDTKSADWDAVKTFISSDDWQKIAHTHDKATSLMVIQGHRIYDGMRANTLQGFDSFQLEGCLAQLSAYQAQCERIKHIPIPRQYTFFTRLFVWVFLALLPFSFIPMFSQADLGWLLIPMSMLIAFVFSIVERTGAVNEEPFENRITDVPMSAYCIEIERDLRVILEEDAIPAQLQPENGYLF